MCRSAETVSLIKSCRRACYRYHLISILKGIFDITETRIVLEISDGLLPQPIILGNIYRPPRNNNDNSNIRNFTYELSTVLNEFTKLNYSIIITGDFNINLFEINERACYGEFLDMIISTELYPKISLPTQCRTKVSQELYWLPHLIIMHIFQHLKFVRHTSQIQNLSDSTSQTMLLFNQKWVWLVSMKS